MLFNSLEFVLVFLPAAWLGFFMLARVERQAAIGFLAVASMAFYGWWDPRYVLLLGVSILFNYVVGRALARHPGERWYLLVFGVTTNLGVLGWFKYTNFVAGALSSGFALDFTLGQIVLPLGISFFTFTQIAFLVDAHRGQAAEYRLTQYFLFASFFPHLIAGPILHHREMMPQFDRVSIFRPDGECIARGLTMFTIGLFKKVVLADGLAPYASTVFDAAQAQPVTFVEAWSGGLAYTFQLYFDFSGYSDMAVGAALLFGILLPLNFNSPYKATSIIEFWRRWHMTLSRFLRDYLYFPLGGNRLGPRRRCFNLLVVMVLGGLWHGAGWTFALWGAWHGACLLANHAWRSAQLGPSRACRSQRSAAACPWPSATTRRSGCACATPPRWRRWRRRWPRAHCGSTSSPAVRATD